MMSMGKVTGNPKTAEDLKTDEVQAVIRDFINEKFQTHTYRITNADVDIVRYGFNNSIVVTVLIDR